MRGVSNKHCLLTFFIAPASTLNNWQQECARFIPKFKVSTQGIWVPFLIIAPASTLHNWQQECARFIPKFKVSTQGIWVPFLIIAPASTLHNWQQECARFIPGPRSAVGNVSGYRCVSDCRSRGLGTILSWRLIMK